MEEEIEFPKEWLELEKYYFKLLTIITVLADNKRAFRGKLSDLCKNLSIQASAVNTRKMKQALEYLEINGYVHIIIDVDIYTISLTKLAENNKKIIKLKKAWYQIIRDADSDVSWENILKVLLVIIDRPHDIMTYAEIGEKIKCSKYSVQRAVKTISSLKFGHIMITKDVIKEKHGDIYRTLGTTYSQAYFFQD